MKPYRTIPIQECGEPLVKLSERAFKRLDPHPYIVLDAPYGGANPWQLRAGVAASLHKAQEALRLRKPGWSLLLFDAYRPNAVQAFMVEREFQTHSGGRPSETVPEPEKAAYYEKTFRIWGIPSDDPKTPPPHSTGAAIDLTLTDDTSAPVDMGSPLDENSERSMPDHFIDTNPEAHMNREILCNAMRAAGFTRHPAEWWHFSLGDQMWALRQREDGIDANAVAVYGRADLVNG